MEEDVCVGSLRSIADVDVLQCLEHPAVQPHLRTFGGHAQAAGCTIATEEFERVAVGLSQAMTDAGMTETTLVPLLMLDAELKKSALSLELGKRLSSLEPFGAKNEEPVFLLKDQECTVPRVVGTDGRHLQCRIGGTKAIGFGLGEFAETIASGERIDVACKINVSTWNGREELQYVIRDFRRGSKI
jgi:single-stranded-DNA-specific exonuclease